MDTIAALATAPAAAALALIRISGPQAHTAASALCGRHIPIRRPIHTVLRDASGTVLDDVVMTAWQGPSSYTGEDMVEISCHGNMRIVEAILSACSAHGVRPARPGEFTERAFLNERIDLTQAEAVMDLIQASSARALRAAQALQSGVLGHAIQELRESLLQTLAHLEAYIDFPEEDIDPDTGRAFAARITAVQSRIRSLLATAPEGRRLREGFTVVLCGAPNAGKSSLFNALLGRERAIVSPQPGTTRDTVEETITLAGMPVRLIDTAGLRDEPDAIEALGIQRTQMALESADLVLHLNAADAPSPTPETNAPVIEVAAKCDQANICATPVAGLAVSSLTGEGLEELQRTVIRQLRLDETSHSHESVAINTRHEALLQEAQAALERAQAAHQADQAPELVSADLRCALNALSGITGETTNEDILDRLFRSFCIGK